MSERALQVVPATTEYSSIRLAAQPVQSATPARPSEVRHAGDIDAEESISEADLPLLPMEQYTSVWEAILAHL